MSYAVLHQHSHNSILDGLSKPKQIAEKCARVGATAAALTDHGNVSGAADFMKECNKKGVKPILGCEFYVAENGASLKKRADENPVAHQVVLAKNPAGWKKLIKLVSQSNDKENFYTRPRIDVEMLRDIDPAGDLVSFSGHLGSTLHKAADPENYANMMGGIFGRENFFVEIQRVDYKNSYAAVRLAKQMRDVSEATGLRKVATGDCHYPSPADAFDHQVLLCSAIKKTMSQIQALRNTGGDVPFSGFFNSDRFFIPSEQDLVDSGNSPDEIASTGIIADMCELYDITGPPRPPAFPWTDGLTEAAYLRKLCEEGLQRKIAQKDWPRYRERLNEELGVFEGAGLSGYFLIVQDYVNWAKQQGWLIGPGRGSALGCLVSYLVGITNIDPLPYGLLFERFYNAGRNTADRVSYPDIDMDFPKFQRPHMIARMKDRYGHDRVCQMQTFGRMQGRGALKEVLRVHNVCPHEEMNEITKNLPQEAEIADQLEDSGETSIIRWTLMNEPDSLGDWAHIDDQGKVSGVYSQFFEQAIRLEGTFKSSGKHAAGIIISAEPLDEVCPMVNDKSSDEKIAGMDMNALESMGHIKFDILGVTALDKLQAVNNLLRYGKIKGDCR